MVAEQQLVESVAPIQLGIRLLIPAGSRLLELDEVQRGIGEFDAAALIYPWRNTRFARGQAGGACRMWLPPTGLRFAARKRLRESGVPRRKYSMTRRPARATGAGPTLAASGARRDAAIPHLSEAWYCCAEPTRGQFVAIAEASPVVTQQPEAFV